MLPLFATILAIVIKQTTAVTCPSRFAWETSQLTDATIANSNAGSLFDFSSDEASNSSKASPLPACKAFPGDASWPSPAIWNLFNLTLGGALIKTVPLAAPCYTSWPQHDAATCQYVTDHWADVHLHVADPTSAMFPLYQGQTCMPPSLAPPNVTDCTLGGYAAYSVAVTCVAHIQLALNFARNTNVRLVVRNTGHDFNDKSVGAGALSIWTHKLKDIQFIADYRCGAGGYSGPAFRLGSGVETEDVYRAAEANNVTAVGGECRVSSPMDRFRGS
jgi:hypothetical protein